MNLQQVLNPPKVLAKLLEDDGAIPNNPKLPLLVYQGAINLPERNPVSIIEDLFRANQWGNSWRNGIFRYHHYHSTAQEVLVCYSGTARVKLGGESGIDQSISRGDVIIIPAGVGHKNLGDSPDFRVVGAYPSGQTWDLLRGHPGERPQADEIIARVPLPPTDPIYGNVGPLIEHWLNQD